MKRLIPFALALGLACSALAHEGHENHEGAPAANAPTAQPLAAGGTKDAQTYFTDTLLRDQNGKEVRFYSDVLKGRLVMLNVIFTHCNDACPLITRKLKEVRAAMSEELAS